MMTADEFRRRLKDIRRDRAARARLADRVLPGLPVDADPAELRHRAQGVGGMLDGIVTEILTVKNAWYDAVCAQWDTLFPGLVARPMRFTQTGGKMAIDLRVPSSGHVFALRSRLPAIRRTLLALEGAPKGLVLYVKIA